MIRIRSVKDFRPIQHMDHVCFPNDAPYPTANGALWWIAWVNGEGAGFAGLKILTGKNKGLAYLCRAGVLPLYRGLGIQRRLINTRVAAAARLGSKAVISYTSYENLPSANNLIKCGFKLYEPAETYGTKHGLYFWRDLK